MPPSRPPRRRGDTIRPFMCEGAVGVGECRWFGTLEPCAVVPGARGRTRRRAVGPGSAQSYPEARGRTRKRAVVPGGARSYLKDPLRYDRAALRTTARAGGTTTRLYVRPRGTDDARRRSGIRSPAPRAPQADGARRADQRRGARGTRGTQQDPCRRRCAHPQATRDEHPGPPGLIRAGARPGLLQRSRLPVSTAEKNPEHQRFLLRVPAETGPLQQNRTPVRRDGRPPADGTTRASALQGHDDE